jgi:type IV pilus assembly protein PilB
MLNLPQNVDNALTTFLKDNGLVTDDNIAQATTAAQTSGESIVTTLLRSAAFTEDALSSQFAEFYGLEKTTIDDETLANDRPLRDKIKGEQIQHNRVWPLKLEGQNLITVVADPIGLMNVNKIQMLASGFTVETKIINLSDMTKCLASMQYGEEGMSASAATGSSQFAPIDEKNAMANEGVKTLEGAKISGMASNPVQRIGIVNPAGGPTAQDLGLAGAKPKELSNDAKLASQMTQLPGGTAASAPKGEAKSGFEVIDFVDNVIQNAISMGVSDIHLEAFRESARVRYRINGVLQEIDEYRDFLTFNYQAITTRLKILSSLDISERRLPQDGGISFEVGSDKNVDIRLSTLPTSHGERVVMRIMDPESANFALDDLGFKDAPYAAVKKAISAPQGMILVTGPTGSGKSTTLYAILRELNKEDINIMTAEDPVEYDLFGVGQVRVKDEIGLTFTAALRSFLRQDPEIIMVGEIRDKDTGDIAIKASLTGHLVLSTLHTNDAPSTITRMINMGIPDYLITSSLTLIIAQRLGRVICDKCKTEDESKQTERLLAFGFGAEEAATIKTYYGKGCSQCLDTGIKGRRAIHEVLQLNDDLREAILKGASNIEIRKLAQTFGFITMQQTGRQLIADGVISVDEFQRILVLD